MKRFILSLLLTILCSALSAQQKLSFSVLEFEQDVFDTSAKSAEYGKKDGNGSWYAIIKVTSNNPDDDITACQFNFGNMSSKVERHNDALWIYVQRNAKTVTITRPGYYTIEKYDLQTTIEAGAVYKMVLKGAVTHQKLHIKCTPSDAVVLIDGEVIEENPITLPLGTHKYTAAANGYISQSGSVDVKENAPAKLIIELDKKVQSETGGHVSSANGASSSPVSTPADKPDNRFNEVFDALSQWFGIKTGETTLDDLRSRYNVKKEYGSYAVTIDDFKILCHDTDGNGVLNMVYNYPKTNKGKHPDFVNGLNLGSNYDEWNRWLVSKGFEDKPFDSKQSQILLGIVSPNLDAEIIFCFTKNKIPEKSLLKQIMFLTKKTK